MNTTQLRFWDKLPPLVAAALFLATVWAPSAQAAARTASVNGNWNATATWGGLSVPGSADSVTVNSGITVTVPAGYAARCTTIGFTAGANSTAINLASATASLTASGAVTITPQSSGTSTSTINVGAGTFSAASVTLSGAAVTRYTQLLISTGTATISGNITSAGTDSRITFSGAGTLNAGGTFLSGTAGTFTAGTGTVNFNAAAAQTVGAYTFWNLTLSGSLAKTTTGVTVNGILSMEGTATASAAPTYGASATLQYNTATARSAGVEWITQFAASGGVIIANTGTITLNSYKIFNPSVPLTIASGATLDTSAANRAVTFGGAFINNGGTFTANASPVTINGTAAAQSIAGYTTTGVTSMTKTAGTATFTGNVNGADLTINGTGGTLNLGAGRTHTFTGTWTRTAGTVEGGSSTLNVGGILSDTGGSFTSGTSTVNYSRAGTQTIPAVSYNNLILSGSSAKTMPTGTAVTGNLSIAPTGTATASIGSGANLSVGSLTLGGLGRINGTWGSSSSIAASTNNTYFVATSGYLSVTTDTRTTPSVTTWPTASGITVGQALSSSTLTGGAASVPGSFAFTAPSTVPPQGNYSAAVTFAPTDGTSYRSVSGSVTVKVKPAATVTLGSLSHTYDGASHAATATTVPAGLTVTFTYNGSATAPTAVGSYAVVGAVNDANYGGSSSGTLAIAKAVTAFDPPSLPREAAWVANGAVNALVRTADKLYLAGAFTYVGPNTGFGVALDPAAKQPVAVFPKLDNGVTACVPDGSGGYYVAGYFTLAGTVTRNRILHLKSDGTVDAAWNPNADGYVSALAVSGTTVYAGGQFTSIGGASRNNLAALEATTGNATAWNPNPNNRVSALAVAGTTVYVGGVFGTIGGASRNNFAALSASTGLATAWNPATDNTVEALAVFGTTVYAAGRFTTIGGQARNRIAAIDTTTSTVTAWNPNAGNVVYALAVSADGSTVYAGGAFSTIGGQTRNNLAALSASTGLATAWNPTAGSYVNALAVSGANVYAGGYFTTIGGQTRNYVAELDAATGLATTWELHAGSQVIALAASGTTVFAGGNFTSIGGVPRNRIAALDATTGTATTWNPNAGGEIYCMAVSGSAVYVGGAFNTIGGGNRNRLAALDATTGLATWADLVVNNYPRALAVSRDGATVYVGGEFSGSSSLGGLTRNRLAAVTAATGAVTAWDPNAGNTVYALAVSGDGSTVYAGGQFTTVNGATTRNRLAALNTAGVATAWNPNAGGIVRALAVSGWTTYAGGEFTTIGGATRNRLAALDSTGAATAWDPNAGGIVRALAVSDATVYAGGDFGTVNGATTRNYLAALATATGTATTWDPNANNSVNALAFSADGTTTYAGGAFTTLGGNRYGYLAQFGPQAGSTTTVGSSANPSTYGASVTFTATVSPSTASGTVTFKVGVTTLGTGTLSGGTATYATSALSTGGHTITAVYSGGSSYATSTSAGLSQTVNKATPSVTTWPTASAITYGQTLASSTLTGGAVTPPGSFAWTTPTTAPNAGTASQGVTFTPADTANYTTTTGTASVTVNKATPTVTTWPTASAITYGQTLAASTLSGGSATPTGSFAWTAPTTAPGAGTAARSVTFTPTDTANYSTVIGSASVTVATKSLGVTGLSAADKFYDGAVTAALTGTPVLVAGDIVGSDNVSLAGGTPVGAFADREVGSGKAVTYASGLTLQGTAAPNYHLTGSAATAAIFGTQTASGTTTITAANSLTFDLTLNAGTVLANNNPADGSINGNGTIQVNSGATLGGNGKVGQVSVNTGGTIAPGNSVGTLNTDSQTWGPSGNYEWEVNDALGTAGSDPGWDLLSINGTLDITATSGSKFTLHLATLAGSTPGSAANFHNAHLYAWPIATASGGISGFDPAAFTVDAAEFANTPLAGAFRVAQYGNSVYVVYQPTDCLAPVQPTWLGVAAESSLYMWYTNASGLKEVWETIAVNCTITAKAFDIAGKTIATGLVIPLDRSKYALPLGTTGIELVAKKILTGSSNPGSVSTSATTFCGLYSSTDPTLVDLVVLAGGVVTQRLERVPSVERYLQVLNGRPGLKSLAVSVNGQALPLGVLVDGGYLALDLESFMVEGENNTVDFTGTGDAGASAFILLTDTPSSAPLPVGPRLTLSLTPGGMELAWLGDPAQWQLLTSPAVAAAWVPVLTAPTTQNGLNSVALSLGAGNQFFRLQGRPAAAPAARLAGRQSFVGLSGTNSQPQLKAIYGSLTW